MPPACESGFEAEKMQRHIARRCLHSQLGLQLAGTGNHYLDARACGAQLRCGRDDIERAFEGHELTGEKHDRRIVRYAARSPQRCGELRGGGSALEPFGIDAVWREDQPFRRVSIVAIIRPRSRADVERRIEGAQADG